MERSRFVLWSCVVFIGFVVILSLWGRPYSPKERSEFVGPVVSKEVLNLQDSFANVAEKIKPAVVSISTKQIIKEEVPTYPFYFGDPFEDFFDEFFGWPQRRKKEPEKKLFKRKLEGIGSGVIIDPDGYILTNHHVVRGASDITVIVVGLKGETRYDGKVVGKDERTDLAVVKIKPREKLAAAPLGDSDKLRVGDWALAIGSPFGLELEQTVTSGIISAKRQSLEIEGRLYKDMIQTDAAINRGNSGGPLLNIYGEVIGINTAIFTPSGAFAGIGFAVPINKAKEILDDLIHGRKIVRGWLGVEIKQVDKAIAKQFGLSDETGVLVNNVLKDSPAEKSGIKRGDIIKEFGGNKIKTPIELQDMVAKTKPKKIVEVLIVRNKQAQKLQIELGEMPEKIASGDEKEPSGKEELSQREVSKDWLGMKVKGFSQTEAEELGVSSETYRKDEKGVVVVEVEPGSKADDAGILRGDIIRAINGKQTTTILEFEKVTKIANISDGIVFDINRGGRLMYLSITAEE